jgi:hypothetical protein
VLATVRVAGSLAADCTHPTATAATYAPAQVGSPAAPRVGPITFHPYPYLGLHPTKVLIHRVGMFQGSLSLTGYNCRDGRVLRFWYRNTAALPAPLDRRPNEGDPVAVLRFYRSPVTDYGGYMLFTEPGRWNIMVSNHGAVLGNLVITAAHGCRGGPRDC